MTGSRRAHRKQRCLKVTNRFVSWSGCSTPGASALFPLQPLDLLPLLSIFLSSLLVRMLLLISPYGLTCEQPPLGVVLKGTPLLYQEGCRTRIPLGHAHSNDRSMQFSKLGNWPAMILRDIDYPHPFGHPQGWFGLHSLVSTDDSERQGKGANVRTDSETSFCEIHIDSQQALSVWNQSFWEPHCIFMNKNPNGHKFSALKKTQICHLTLP